MNGNGEEPDRVEEVRQALDKIGQAFVWVVAVLIVALGTLAAVLAWTLEK